MNLQKRLNNMKPSTQARLMVAAMSLSAVAPAFAVDDYSAILTGLVATGAITAIIAAGSIKAGLGFAKWATNKVARFFG